MYWHVVEDVTVSIKNDCIINIHQHHITSDTGGYVSGRIKCSGLCGIAVDNELAAKPYL